MKTVTHKDHIVSNPGTLLVRFLGLHCLSVRKDRKAGKGPAVQKVYFVVMNNMFNTPFEIHRRYDLKGSWVGRVTTGEFDPSDLDFTKANEKIRVGEERKAKLVAQIERDSSFLKENNVIDYSLLLGIYQTGTTALRCDYFERFVVTPRLGDCADPRLGNSEDCTELSVEAKEIALDKVKTDARGDPRENFQRDSSLGLKGASTATTGEITVRLSPTEEFAHHEPALNFSVAAMPKLAVLNEAEEEIPEGANSAEVVVGIADMIGIDIVNEPQFLWIAEEASRAHIPPDWKELTNEDGEVLYYHTQERKLQKVHPLILRYQEVYYKARSYTKQLESGQIGNLLEQTDAKMAAITASVMGRASKGLPPATPEVVESLARVLSVDSKKEFFLFRVVKQTIEAYVEKKLDLSSIIQDLKDPIEFLRQIRKKQNQVDVIRKPTTVVMCQECENRAAVLKCEQCKDYFCQDCFNSTHATGKRRAHITSDVEQLVCAAFEDRVATCQCVQCGLFYSDEGFMHVHAWDAARPDLRNHLKRVINGLVCLECEHYNASVLCEDCVDLFCTECFIRLHRKGKRRQHVHLTIDNTGQIFRGGFLVPPEEAQVLTDRARSTVETGPWVPFRDDELNVYWYHLMEKRSVSQSPVDPVTGVDAAVGVDPLPDEEEEAE
eukprot:s1785_g3.t1